MSTSKKLLAGFAFLLVGIEAAYVPQCQKSGLIEEYADEYCPSHFIPDRLKIHIYHSLRELRGKMIQAGFSNIDFLIINTRNSTEKYNRLTNVSGEIPVYQEGEEERTFESLGAGKDHILVVDKCNRLAYQVIMPWSILHYPYVKAAILSTYKDDPCGLCQDEKTENSEITPSTPTTEELSKTRNRTMEELLKNDVPLVTENQTSTTEKTNNLQNHGKPVQRVTEKAVETENQTISQNNTKPISEQENITKTETVSIHEEDEGMQRDEPRDAFADVLMADQSQQNLLHHSGNYPKRDNVKYDSPALEEIIGLQQGNGNKEQSSTNWKKRTEKNYKENTIKGSDNGEDAKKAKTNLRIILSYPHYHSSGENVTAHDYLVLETGNPNYHGHNPSSYESEKSVSTPNYGIENVPVKTKTMTETLEYPLDPEKSIQKNIEKDLEETEIEKILKERFSDKGLNTENTIWQKRTETRRDPDESKISNPEIDKKEPLLPPEESDSMDELVAHYSKLLSWIYYAL